MGLAFALLLIFIDPADIAILVDQGGKQIITVFVGTLVLIFASGATLTRAVFIITEDP